MTQKKIYLLNSYIIYFIQQVGQVQKLLKTLLYKLFHKPGWVRTIMLREITDVTMACSYNQCLENYKRDHGGFVQSMLRKLQT